MKLTLEDVPLSSLGLALAKKVTLAVIIAVFLPVSLVVAEPSLAGSTAVLENTSPTAKASFERFEGRTIKVEISAYNAGPGNENQTDSTPCILANGRNYCTEDLGNIAAANFLPFGTKFIVPAVSKTMVWEVMDRMNRRYDKNIDLLVETKTKAENIGRQTMEVIVLN